jgi:tetratricopeptide (TPR) repeat protein
MRAFIIRPFGKRNGIDFDKVARVLISPALEAIGAEGRETLDIVEAGNIRVDMFRRLLTADLVVADLSVHNANVFYELGIRHALRDRSTFMLRCDAHKFPFDLQTDRYFTYRKERPGASLKALVAALRRTKELVEKDASARDSPVFMSLPGLREPDPSQFMIVPQDFGEEVARAAAGQRAGDLALLSYEAKGFEWETRGWRAVGRAQFDLKALAGARETWEQVRDLEPDDLEANLLLGTIYERLGDLTGSTQALERALANGDLKPAERAEAYSLLARNAKTTWRGHWEGSPAGERRAVALRSPHLLDSFENYERAFYEDLNHFYSGLNALAMLKVMTGLAGALPHVWRERFKKASKADDKLEEYGEHADKLSGAVELSLAAAAQRLGLEGRNDVLVKVKPGRRDFWGEISAADYRLLTADGAHPYVAAAYRDALAGAPDFAAQSVSRQLAIYRDLGVLCDNLASVFKVVGQPPPLPVEGALPVPSPPRRRVLIFAGHMIDAPGRRSPRFPADKEQVAREKIREAVEREMAAGAGVACGYAGGASGGDLLFQEVCDELGIETRLYLAIQPQQYVVSSVEPSGGEWVRRFWKLYNARQARGQVRVLNEEAEVNDESEHLPAWLRPKEDYGIWQRNNLWMLFNALDEACDPKSDDPNITLIALWDGEAGDGAGGTGDLVDKVKKLGARFDIIDTKKEFGLGRKQPAVTPSASAPAARRGRRPAPSKSRGSSRPRARKSRR